jgi:hypothetical protein
MYPQGKGQTIYNNLYNNNNYQNKQSIQNNIARKNQISFNNNNNNNNVNNKNLSNLKYGDLEIQAFFSDGGNQNSSAKDMQLLSKLDIITNQYMAIFDNVNKMANQFSGGANNTLKLNNIKKELEEIDSYNAEEYSKFLGELYEIANKDPNILSLDYTRYKLNPKDCDEKIKETISNFKYDVVLSINQHNSQENIKRLKKYIEDKRGNSNNYNNNNDKKSYENPNNNNYYGNQNKSSMQFNYGNSIYGNQNQEKKENPQFGFGNSIYSGQNSYNKKYENPNEIGNGDIYGKESNNYRNKSIYGNNYNPNQYDQQNYNDKITVRIVHKGVTKTHEYNSNESGELLYYAALELKDDPKIYDKKGRVLFYETLKEMRIKDIFNGVEPAIDVY